MKYLISLLISLIIGSAYSQTTGIIKGTIKDKETQELLPLVNILVESTNLGTTTDFDGNYRLELPTGTYNLVVSFVGYQTARKFNIELNSGNAQIVNFELSQGQKLKEFEVTFDKEREAATTDMVTPLSVQQLTTQEIKANPGGNFDVSKVVQTLPGVGGSAGGGGRNDITIRGGAPNENVYYLDGIEIPIINHFQTQGSSGGAQGILNVSFIDNLKLSSSAFDARYDNALASTFVIKQRDGNNEKLSGNVRTSLTESSFTLEGPLSKDKKTVFLASARTSYLDLLFTLIDLPIRPNFSDFQYKVTRQIDKKTTFTALGVGAIDRFKFAKTKDETPENTYLRGSLPFINQWNYTTGFAFKRLVKDGYYNITASRNMFDNQLDQFEGAQNDNEEFRNLGLNSQEIENKFRFDINKFQKGFKYSYGVMAQYVKYNTSIYNKLSSEITDSLGNVIVPAVELNFGSAIDFFKYGVFGQISKKFFKNKLLISAGIRSDMNSFTDNGNNPLSTLSPRLSFSYKLSPKVDLTASLGSYYKIPTYTSLGFQDNAGNYVNRGMEYIQSNHYVLGAQWIPNSGMRITVEGFYKTYNNYPVSIANGSSLANQGTQFGSIGSEAVTSSGEGKTYGAELFIQQKLVKNLFYVFSYTYVRSLYSGLDGEFVASAWDNQHLVSTTLGYNFKKNWKLGAKFRFAGGVPYTPFDLIASQTNFTTLGVGQLDFTRLNQERLDNFSQLDLRVDKIMNFKKVSVTFYIDIQNLLLTEQETPPYYTFKRNADNTGFETTDGQTLKQDGSNGIPVILENRSANVTPTLGIIFEF
ncbi:TonB-dependent receptor [Flavobacteriales bacterium]|nr:TonB-dependent receptor [Flavobacteriales bacterium]